MDFLVLIFVVYLEKIKKTTSFTYDLFCLGGWDLKIFF